MGTRRQWKVYVLLTALTTTWIICIIHEARTHLYGVKLIPLVPGVKNIHFWKHRPRWVSREAFSKCKLKCKVTEGKYIPENSDAIVFHSPDTWLARPPTKPMGQIWVFFSLEPPLNLKMSFYNWQKVFNWTMSYRRDADIYYPYGNFTTDNIIPRKQAKTKPWTKTTAAWFVSNCHTQSKRERFVKLLRMYMNVHVFGDCGSYTCKRHQDTQCLEKLDENYNYYLSFENSLCRDYVTEKFFRGYKLSNVVPVVRGNSYYSMYGPPDSFIDSSKFNSTRKLARYLTSIASSEKIFSSFFQSRDNYHMEESISAPHCELCRRLHNPSAYKRLYDDIGRWVFGSDHVSICVPPNDLKL
ncbi:alpha-(1,3)-fucosyltransferase C-like [Argopecten irradians]|uniref:alpha-(1,3)-fucosyltransferase C-like n=1 Tax=Argopecten irradians TaxID=31199 RepID=UPI00371BA256